MKGDYRNSLSDARAAVSLQPSYLKAIVRGNHLDVFNTFINTSFLHNN